MLALFCLQVSHVQLTHQKHIVLIHWPIFVEVCNPLLLKVRNVLLYFGEVHRVIEFAGQKQFGKVVFHTYSIHSLRRLLQAPI
ncbi:hypothetical protein SDC9_116458 [bioreactor metagenome]|uniref:Uncharacterized protein n=1 Tax=bioreactor metagenome TaxID=1076179 RepID=A0A645C2D3_9ZZZZ